jgi:uncharacterized DUF497 family protein
MRLDWDPAKDAQNVARRGLSFALVERLDWDTAQTVEDTREAYGERRYITVGWIDARLHVLIWTPRGDTVRVISLRKADAHDRRIYAEATKPVSD